MQLSVGPIQSPTEETREGEVNDRAHSRSPRRAPHTSDEDDGDDERGSANTFSYTQKVLHAEIHTGETKQKKYAIPTDRFTGRLFLRWARTSKPNFQVGSRFGFAGSRRRRRTSGTGTSGLSGSKAGSSASSGPDAVAAIAAQAVTASPHELETTVLISSPSVRPPPTEHREDTNSRRD